MRPGTLAGWRTVRGELPGVAAERERDLRRPETDMATFGSREKQLSDMD